MPPRTKCKEFDMENIKQGAIGSSFAMSEGVFRGYAEAKGRKPLVSVKGVPSDELLGQEQVAGSGKDIVGVLAPGVVCIIPGSSEESAIMAAILEGEKMPYVATKAGNSLHFFFGDMNGLYPHAETGLRLACGILADVKTGSTNGTDSVKLDGNLVQVIDKANGGHVSDLPTCFRPVQGNAFRVDTSDVLKASSFITACADALLQAGISEKEARETLRIIDEYCVGFKVPEDEFGKLIDTKPWPDQTLAMDFWDEKRRFHHDRCSRWYMERFHVLQIRGQIASWSDRRWKTGSSEVNHLLAVTIPTLKKKERDEVINQIRAIVPTDKDAQEADTRYIGFTNGILDVTTGILHELSPDYVLTNIIPHAYDPTAESELGEKMMQGFAAHDPQVQNMLEELIGYGMSRDSELSKVFFLLGNKDNGKSTFIDALKLVFGDENAAFLNLNQLGERFMLQELDGKLVCLGDDIPAKFADDTLMARLRTVSNGQTVTAERKGEDAYHFSPYVTLIWTLNEMPRVADPTGATTRRFIIIPFDGDFHKGSPDRIEGLQKSLIGNEEIAVYLIRKGVEGLRRIRTQGFTRCKRIEDELHSYAIANDPTVAWVTEYGIDNIIGKTSEQVFPIFCTYLSDSKLKSVSRPTFKQRLEAKFNLVNDKVEHRPDKASYRPYRLKEKEEKPE